MIEVLAVPLDTVLPLRELYRREMNCQIVHDSLPGRGFGNLFLIRANGRAAGYGFVMGYRGEPKDMIQEFYVLPAYRGSALPMFRRLIEMSQARRVEVQSNDVLLTLMLYDCATEITSDRVVFHDALTTSLSIEGVTFREVAEADQGRIFEQRVEPVGEWLLEHDGRIVATGGIAFHYNPPYGDIFMEVDEPFRKRGYGSYLIQELKRVCYEMGKVPAARCNATNVASRAALQKAGLFPCARMLSGVLPVNTPEPEVRAADPVAEIKEAIRIDDTGRVRSLLERHPELRARINDPIGPFDSPALHSARSRAMLDALVDHGADLNARSRWWAGGFGFLDTADPELAAYAIERGAVVDVHAAARLGLFDRLRGLVEADHHLVHARGGDGQTPLHFASTVPIASYLLDHGADIDALDVDHESTPAQYMLDHRPDVARHLVERGSKVDLLMASALGDVDRVRALLDADPGCLRIRASDEFFPMANPRAGGHIYRWTLGENATAYHAAAKFGHGDVLRLLLDRSPPEARLVAACWLGDDAAVRALLADDPALASRLAESDRAEVARAARNNHADAVRRMLEAGLPATARGQHNATPLHWAAWHGNLPMVEALLRFAPPLEDTKNDFHATPLGWATHGSENGWHCRTGDYPGVVQALLEAGARPLEEPRGTEAVKDVQRRFADRHRSA